MSAAASSASVHLAASTKVDGVALSVLLFFFILVTVGGFWAANWRRADSPHSLDEWGLGGRSFGTVITWFLLGGDLYTAYTFIAVPAAMFATGAVTGFFAVAYTILIYPIVFIFMPRMWSVAHSKGYVTAADFVRGRFDSRILALAVAVTGIIATMPYIALQLVGIQAVIDTIGIGGRGNAFVRDLPLLIAFAVLAAYTYSSGLRAPAIIAFVKDSLIYLVIAVAIVYVGVHVGFHHLFEAAETKMTTKNPKTGAAIGSFIPASNNYWAYATLALGSALALFMYPHSMTAVLSGKSRNVIRRNTAILPAYSLLLAMLALLGYAAIASKTSVIGSDGKANPQLAVPHFFRDEFPSWFAGIAYSAIAIGALVPAAIMSIAAANMFTRNVYKEFLVPRRHPQAGGTGRQDHLAGGQVRRAGVRAGAGQAERHQPAAARRGLDPADHPGDRGRALHPMAAPVGAAGRLGRRHHLRNHRGLPPEVGCHPALRRFAGDLPVHPHQGLHRLLGAGAQHPGDRAAHPGAAGGEGARGRRCHHL